MSTKIFVNLAVKDLKKSIDFFTKLGYTFNQQFTDETATCMIISEHIYVMLLTHNKFKSFIKKEIADSTKTTEAILALTVDSRDEVDLVTNKAVKAGATATDKQDHGFMYSWGFQDLDGHLWEVFWMDPAAIKDETPKETTASY